MQQDPNERVSQIVAITIFGIILYVLVILLIKLTQWLFF